VYKLCIAFYIFCIIFFHLSRLLAFPGLVPLQGKERGMTHPPHPNSQPQAAAANRGEGESLSLPKRPPFLVTIISLLGEAEKWGEKWQLVNL
jgi:hypothetical protein